MIISNTVKLINFLEKSGLERIRFVFLKRKDAISEMFKEEDIPMVDFYILLPDVYFQFQICSVLRFAGFDFNSLSYFNKHFCHKTLFIIRQDNSYFSDLFFDCITEDSKGRDFSYYREEMINIVALIESFLVETEKESLTNLLELKASCQLKKKLVMDFSNEEGMKTVTKE